MLTPTWYLHTPGETQHPPTRTDTSCTCPTTKEALATATHPGSEMTCCVTTGCLRPNNSMVASMAGRASCGPATTTSPAPASLR